MHGTPQDSIVGLLLFSIYVNEFPNCLTGSVPNMYADDTNLILSHVNMCTLISMGNLKLQNISNWLKNNKFVLNASKTKAIKFRTRNIEPNIPSEQLIIDKN